MSWHMLRALRQRSFRLYFLGQVVSLNGTWMQHVAQSWLVYEMTGSSFMLGLVAFLGLSPIMLLGLFAGTLADRFSRRRLLLTVQVLALIQASLLAALTLSGVVEVWHIILLSMLLGVSQAFEMPARHAFIGAVVPKADLPNAIALNSSLFNSARFIGPALAGILVTYLGVGWVFLLNALSFTPLLWALWITHEGQIAKTQTASEGGGIRGGLAYAWRTREVRAALLMVWIVSLVGAPYTVLMPVFAREVFGGGAQILGWLLSLGGGGSLLGALYLAQRRGQGGFERLIARSGLVAGVMLLLFAQSETFYLSAALLLPLGFAMTTIIASCNTYIQLQVPDALRGRIMALFSVLFIGMTPVGNLLAGTLGEWLSAPMALTINGALCVVTALAFLLLGARSRRRAHVGSG